MLSWSSLRMSNKRSGKDDSPFSRRGSTSLTKLFIKLRPQCKPAEHLTKAFGWQSQHSGTAGADVTSVATKSNLNERLVSNPHVFYIVFILVRVGSSYHIDFSFKDKVSTKCRISLAANERLVRMHFFSENKSQIAEQVFMPVHYLLDKPK